MVLGWGKLAGSLFTAAWMGSAKKLSKSELRAAMGWEISKPAYEIVT